MSNSRRANRRRTGPLSAEQREKAALIRKLGACPDCRRRRVACNPLHHNMTWEDAVRKYRSHSPTMQELAPIAGRPLSPAPMNNHHHRYSHDQLEMELDSPPQGRPSLSESRIRTPLPSGPRLEKTAAAAIALPGIESLKSDLQGMANRISSNPYRSRYSSVQALLLYWQDDHNTSVRESIDELREVLDTHYHYTFEIATIPSSPEECKSSWRWLARKINEFVDNRDQRDVLKIVYYNGHTYLDGNREMVLARSKDSDDHATIRWSGIQQILEDALSDILLIMDAAYYPSSKMVRQQGVLEIIAASASEDHVPLLGRTTFTRALTGQLRLRAQQKFMSPFSAAELHARLLSDYPFIVQDRNADKEIITSFPSPLHIQMTGSSRLPSILLSPNVRRRLSSFGIDTSQTGPQVNLTIRLTDDALNMESWAEWLRMMPEGIKDAKVEGPYRNTFR